MNQELIGKVFDYLRMGHFISSNSNNAQEQLMFDFLDNATNFSAAQSYFKTINLRLEQGDGYFYFSKSDNIQNEEKKLQTAFKWIDILDFFKTYDPTFGAGTVFEPAEIKTECNSNIHLKNKLNSLKTKSSSNKSLDKLNALAKELEDNDFAVLLPNGESYKVLSAINYLERLITLINIQEDETTA